LKVRRLVRIYMSGFQPSILYPCPNLGLRPRLVYVALSALFASPEQT
jgi:hypothetical protein